MTATVALMLVVTALMMALGFPIALALIGGSAAYIIAEGIRDIAVIQQMLSGLNSFTLLAAPFFIYAGALMNETGVTNRIFDFAKAVAGWMRGGLGHVNVGASVIFSGMSGAAVADAGGLGSIEIKAMRDAGYDDKFSVGITAASSIIGPIIPPSLPLIIYGVASEASIGKLFVAGIVPGLLMALSLSAMIYVLARRRGYKPDCAFSLGNLARSFKSAFLPLLTPVIIVGGIISGVFTPTEAAIAAVAYVLFLGGIVYRTLTLSKIKTVTLEAAETTGAVLFIVSAATIFAWILTTNRVPDQLSAALLSVTDNKIVLLLIVNLLLLAIGAFMETIAAITIMVPVLLPVAIAAGMDPVHFGIIMILNLMIGLLTPPVGMVLYVLSRVAKIRFETAVAGTLPFLLPLIALLVLLTYVPELSLWLPDFVYS